MIIRLMIRRGGPSCVRDSIMIFTRGCNRSTSAAASPCSAESCIWNWAESCLTIFTHRACLPGFKPDSKVSMLLNLKDQAELVVAINADDIEKSKVRGDLGISYDADVLRLIDAFRGIGMYVGSVVLTRWRDQHSAVHVQKPSGKPGRARVPPFSHRGIPLRRGADHQRPRLRAQRIRRNHPSAGAGHRAGAGQRQDGRMPEPAVSGAPARGEGGLCQV